MNLTTTQKTLIGIAHFLPVIGFVAYLFFFFSFFLNNFANIENHNAQGPPSLAFFKGFFSMFIIMGFTTLLSLGVKIFDIIHVTKSNKKDGNNKVLMWVLLFIFTGIISEIIYYFVEILPEKKEELIENTAT